MVYLVFCVFVLKVLFNNDRKLVWPFHGPRVGEGVPDGAVKPPVRLSQVGICVLAFACLLPYPAIITAHDVVI